MVAGCRPESTEVARRRQPCRERVEDPESLKSLPVGLDRCPSRLVPFARRRGVANGVEGGRRRRCRRVRRQPAPERACPSDRGSDLLEVSVDNSLEVAVELGPQCSPAETSEAGEPGSADLVGVGLQRDCRRTAQFRLVSVKERTKTHARFGDSPLGQRERTHPEADDPPGAGVGPAGDRSGGAGEKEPAGRRVVVHGATNQIPTEG